MAIIQCPSCNGNISDRAEICPHCKSFVFICPECKSVLDRKEDSCPYCGFPITKSQKQKKKRFNFLPLLLVLALFTAFTGAVLHYLNVSQYKDDLASVAYMMLEGGTKAEEAGNFVTEVWYAAIHDEPTVKTATYLVDADDFNDALQNLYSATSFREKLSAISENQSSVADVMKSLLNPSPKYQEAYSALKIMYSDYLTLTNMVMSPDGSYTTYSASLSQAISKFLNSYKSMEIYIEY